jgi:hypothetical protein
VGNDIAAIAVGDARRHWITSAIGVFRGDFMLSGVGDGSNDVPELAIGYENTAILMALLVGTLYASYENAASTAAAVDGNMLGLGSFYLWACHLSLCCALTAVPQQRREAHCPTHALSGALRAREKAFR